MPLYEYRCNQCGQVFEVLQKFSDEPLSIHEKCGGSLQKLVSASALQFKGSGFYVNDYAKASSGATREGQGASDKGHDKSAGKGHDKATDKGKSDSNSKPSDSSGPGKSESSGSGKSDSPSSTPPTSTPSSDTK